MKLELRLKNSDLIGSIVKKRIKVSSVFYTIYYQKANNLKIAVVAGKKIGKANKRNYVKRSTREIIRPYLGQLENIHAVIVAKEQIKNTTFQEKKIDLERLIKKLIERIKNEKNN